MRPATAKQQALLDATVRFTAEHGYPPVVTDLAKATGRSDSTVADHLDRLERKGLIERSGTGRRTLTVKREPRDPKLDGLLKTPPHAVAAIADTHYPRWGIRADDVLVFNTEAVCVAGMLVLTPANGLQKWPVAEPVLGALCAVIRSIKPDPAST